MVGFALLITAVTAFAAPSAGILTSGGGGETPIPIDADSGKYRYREVVEVPGVSADELLSRARTWVARSYEPGKYATELDDEAGHRLGIKAATAISGSTDRASVHYTLTLETKDGRLRYTIGDFTVSTLQNDYGPGLKGYALERVSPDKPIVKQTAEAMHALIADLVAAVQTGG